MRVGDFGLKSVVGTFTPDFSQLMPDTPIAGMNLQSQYLYGGFHGESGNVYVLERKFVGPMSGGNYILSNASGSMTLEGDSRLSARGELVRTIESERRRWVAKGLQSGGDEQPIELTITDDDMTWGEGDLLQLAGPRATLGAQFLTQDRERPIFYASVPYWLTGTIRGEKVEGPIFFDQVYFRHGAEWKEYPYYTEIQVVWNIFANKYADGSIEFGNITKGTEGWGAGIVVEGDTPTAEAAFVDSTFQIDAEGYVTGAAYDLGAAGVWDFVGDESQKLVGFNNARWGGYRAQGGQTRRRGDDREILVGFTWVEAFSDRTKDLGLLV